MAVNMAFRSTLSLNVHGNLRPRPSERYVPQKVLNGPKSSGAGWA